MSALKMNKLSAAQLHDVLERCGLPPEAQTLVLDVPEVSGVIGALVQGGFLVEATRVFAHALPKREAVWWACMCALHTAPETLPGADRKAREMAEEWVRRQSDMLRRAAMEEAQATGFQSPEAWAAVAAFWSGDSIAPLGNLPVPPPPHLTGVAVAGAVALSSVRTDPARKNLRLTKFLQAARDIAEGGAGRLEVEAA
jgi:hypothetical protein